VLASQGATELPREQVVRVARAVGDFARALVVGWPPMGMPSSAGAGRSSSTSPLSPRDRARPRRGRRVAA
jgi:hypothetical protein